ncbi:BatA domain-containing protein [Rhodohalobacter mucosus]|uniref:Aerotolerance regulator N-terminal domain-containing protein n=1 Tax=Rhodohalobacter mucosus TaxID=2079485 RepID=A0A316TWB8_9BACT|nr:BatA domain-containing protein [Rhodohalobacter mucosus]PWN08151.1 hypothetical protein DDZ15_00510 [Rhodohalobacter mucosus]
MSFLNPLFLTALAAIAIPLLIYLFNLRKPKRVRFSTLAFFDSLKNTAIKRLKIKRWLLLTLRMLAVMMLAIAISRPVLTDNAGAAAGSDQDPGVIGILIDNSPGMMQVDRNGPLIDQAKSVALQIAERANQNDRILLETTHGESLNSPFLTGGSARAEIQDIVSVVKGGYTYERINNLKSRLENASEPNKIFFLVTSGRTGHFADFANDPTEEADASVRARIIKIGSESGSNTGFASVDVEEESSADPGELQVRSVVQNYGDQQVSNLFLNLYAGNDLIVQQPVSLGGNEAGEYLFTLPNPDQTVIEAELRIEGDELTFDNRYYLTIQKPQPRNVLVLSGSRRDAEVRSYLTPVLELMAEDTDRFSLSFYEPDELEISQLDDYDAVVLDGIRNIPDYLSSALIDHVQQGAGMLFLPSADGNLDNYNKLLNALGAGSYTGIVGTYGSFRSIDRLSVPESGHPLLEDLFDAAENEEIRLNLPELYYYFEMEQEGRLAPLPVLRSGSGASVMSEINSGNGKVIVSAIGTDPGWSNFPVKPFFAPFFYRSVEYLARGEGAAANVHLLGRPFRAMLPGSADPESVLILKNGDEIIPEIRQTFRGTILVYSSEEWSPGRIVVDTRNPENRQYHSINLDAMESSLQTLDEQEFEEIFGNRFADVDVVENIGFSDTIASTFEDASFGREIWFWFITAAIILLLAESLASRHLKAESIG